MSPDGIACPLADAPVEPAGAEASHGRHGVGQTTRRHDLQEGREPKNVVREVKLNRFRIVSASQTLSNSTNWKDHVRLLEQEVSGQ